MAGFVIRMLDTYQDMIRIHSWLPVLHNDHRPTNTTTIASYVNSSMMVIEVNADELVHLASSPKLAKLANKSDRRPAHANDRTIDIDNIGMVAKNLSTSRQTDI